MSELRWTLLAIGAVVLLGVWLFGRKRPRKLRLDENLIDAVREEEPPELTDVMEPGLDLEEIEALGRSLQRQIGDESVFEEGAGPARDEMILAIHVARPERPIEALELFPALDSAGLSYGRMDIFHLELDDGREAFSVANMVEPGTFDPTTLVEGITTPGVTLFAVLPGPLPAAATFDRMLECANTLADIFDADVLDDTRSVMSRQTENTLRERAAAFDARTRGGHA